jgi:hypothetical protein
MDYGEVAIAVYGFRGESTWVPSGLAISAGETNNGACLTATHIFAHPLQPRVSNSATIYISLLIILLEDVMITKPWYVKKPIKLLCTSKGLLSSVKKTRFVVCQSSLDRSAQLKTAHHVLLRNRPDLTFRKRGIDLQSASSRSPTGVGVVANDSHKKR